jgi:short-subunit dehydrogenase
MNKEKVYTLVTGASNGIGKAFAEEAAARGWNVLLVALPEPALTEVTTHLQAQYPNQHFDSLGVNLMEKEAPEQILAWCKQNNYSLQMLINNAGLGNSGPFDSLAAEFYYGQMQLNMVALVSLTHRCLPLLKAQDKAYVLNVASMAGFYDIPYKGIYSASKKFVLSFSRSLNKELEKTSVSVTALCPGGVLTNEDVKIRTQELGLIARKSAMLPEEVARYTLDKMLQGKQVVLPGTLNKIMRLVSRLIPYSVRMQMMANQFIKNSR